MAVKTEPITSRVGSLIRLRPEYQERYIILHKHVFPEVLDRIQKSNIRNYSIFLKDGMLFSYYEYVGSSYDADMKAIGDTVTNEWWKLTDPMQEPLSDRKEGEWWATMDPVSEALAAATPQVNVHRFAHVAKVKPDSVERLTEFLRNQGSDLIPLFKKTHTGNVHFYIKDGSLYIYREYTGTDWETEVASVRDDAVLREWRSQYYPLLQGREEPMMLVFHID